MAVSVTHAQATTSLEGAPEHPRSGRLLESGVAILVVAVPLAFLPMSAGPFTDLKALLMVAGTLLVWAGSTRSDRRLALASSLWAAVVVAASFSGVDGSFSLAGQDNRANGLILLLPCAYLVVAGAALPSELVRRISRWLFGTAVAVSAVGVAFRFAPGVFEALMPDLSFVGSTLGNSVFLSGMAAVGVIAAGAVVVRRRGWWIAGILVNASALAIAGRRVGWAAAAVGLAILLARMTSERRRILILTGVVAATLAGWTVAGFLSSSASSLTAVPRFGAEGSQSTRERIVTTRVLTRAVAERPLLGWGPATSWGAYLSNATGHDIEEGNRGYSDAHNIVVEVAATSGLLGLAAFLVLGGLVVARMRRASVERTWAIAVAGALLFLHLFQPLNVWMTPLLFLIAGIAAGTRPPEPFAPSTVARVGRAGVGLVLAGALVVASLSLVGSVLEEWGHRYASTWALERSVSIAPWRIGSVQILATYLAEDGDAGDAAAAARARELAEGLVAEHPWDPQVRYIASDVYLIMRELPRARYWLQEQLRVFPADRVTLPSGALEFVRTGRLPSAFPGLEQQGVSSP